MARLPAIIYWLGARWRTVVIVVWPLLLLPLLIVSGTSEAKCGFVVLLMAGYWMTEAIPLPITALLPVVFFPMLGVMSTVNVSLSYMKETNMMSIAGLMMAVAIAHCNLHKRLALKLLLIIGTSPRLLMLGFMLNTMILSMWISNTATVAMMIQIVVAVLEELRESKMLVIRRNSASRARANSNDTIGKSATENGANFTLVDMSVIKVEEEKKLQAVEANFHNEQLCYFLGVAYAANIGGTGTVTGTGTNLIFLGTLLNAYPQAAGVNFASWMMFNVPVMLVNVFVAWIWLRILLMGLLTRCWRRVLRQEPQSEDDAPDSSLAVRRLISRRYAELGSMTWHEGNVLCLFIVLVLLWFFRKPEFMSGWANLLPAVAISDSTPAMAIIILMFILPANRKFMKLKDKNDITPALLDWRTVQDKLPWGLVLLLGGGFAMADASKVSGLSAWLGKQLTGLAVLPTWMVVAIICLMTTFTTEVSSNTAVANILLPVLADMARAIHVHPVYLMMPATLCCSYSFMLPIATPPNAIIAEAANMKTIEMMRAGVVMNLLTIIVLLVAFNTLGVLVFDLNNFPVWALDADILGNATVSSPV